jgi:TonB family protein
MSPNTPDAGPKLLLEDYGNDSASWLDAYSEESPSYPQGPAPVNDLPAPDFLLDGAGSRTAFWLRRFSTQGATGNAPPPILPAAEAPDIRLLLTDYGSFSRLGRGLAPNGRSATISAAAAARPSDATDGLELDGPGPRLTLDHEHAVAAQRRRRAQAASLTAHGVLIVVLLMQPHFVPLPPLEQGSLSERDMVLLVAPGSEELAELGQRSLEPGETTKLFQGLAESPRPALVLPEPEPIPQPDPPRIEARRPPEPAIEIAPPAGTKPNEEPGGTRNREMAAATSPEAGTFRPGSDNPENRVPITTSPFKPIPEPKLQVEDPTAAGLGRDGPLQAGSLKLNARPDEIIEMATENLARGGGKQIVGDGYGAGPGGYLPSSPGNRGSTLELLSDARGVDFRPYLIQVLASVRRNWFAVIPESARLGMNRGRVAIQFIISRNGTVPKLVIADSSSVRALDHAAVAGISASVPFQPLPAEYSGNEIRLQFVFLYNVK